MEVSLESSTKHQHSNDLVKNNKRIKKNIPDTGENQLTFSVDVSPLQNGFSADDEVPTENASLVNNTSITENVSPVNSTSITENVSPVNNASQESAPFINNGSSIDSPFPAAESSTTGGTSPFILTGLHACGDLTATMLRVFVQCPHAVGLASVACCYMKLSTQKSGDITSGDSAGYPMSGYVRGLAASGLSYEAREMACHFVDAYHTKLLAFDSSLKSHVNRAALQEIIHEKDPTLQHGSVKLTFKKTHNLTFAEYAKRALARLDLDDSMSDVQMKRAEDRLTHWKDLVAFYTLRLSLAPAIETLVLLDRMLYLADKGISSSIIPIFEPELSPRNFVLLAHKSSS